jgi:hypothetical protein
MSNLGERDYLLRRAEREHAMAGRCRDAAAAMAHAEMAREYERRARHLAGSSPLQLVG